VADGGSVYSGLGYVGHENGSTGVVTVTGGGSVWTNSGELYVGLSGDGTLTVADGGSIFNVNGNGIVGTGSGSTGSSMVTGSGSVWSNSNDLIVGLSGAGTLTVADGGSVYNTLGTVGYSSGSTGSALVTGSGSVWSNSGELVVGGYGNGALTVADGGSVYNSQGYVGSSSGSTGLVTVTGSNSVWSNSGFLAVGLSGAGTLTVADGGSVYNALGYVGNNSGSTGSVLVTGSGSVWSNSRDLVVGNAGNGTLTVADGGSVYNDYGYVGNNPGSTGSVLVTGSNSVWSNSGNLYVGENGDGTVTVADGGSVYNAIGIVGTLSGSTGSVLVTGSGSVWSNSSALHVGYAGDGTLTVTNGGSVYNTGGVVGAYSGSAGSVLVTGSNSVWANFGDLIVGDGGNGTVTAFDGGRVDVSGNLSVDGNSSIRLGSGGALNVGGDATLASGSLLGFVLSETNGTGKLTVDGTLVNNGATIKLSSVNTLTNQAQYELIRAGNIVNPFDPFDTNAVLSVYEVTLSQSGTNVTATIGSVKNQTTDTPSMARASVASVGVAMNNVSKHTGNSRTLLRNSRFRTEARAGAVPPGPAGPAAGQLASGEWVAYMNQYNDLGGLDSDGAQAGFDWQTSGYMVGMEKLVNPQLIIGVSAGQAWTDLDGLRGSGGGDSKLFITSLYGNWFNESAYCEFGLLYATGDNDTERIDTALDSYTGNYDSQLFGGWVETGWLARKTENTELEPYVRATYISGSQDAYTDAGSGTAPMSVSANRTDNLQLESGARLTRAWDLKNQKTFRLEFKAGAQCEVLDNGVTVNTQVAGSNQQASSPEADRLALVLGARADLGLTDSLNMGIGYEPTFSGNWQNHAIDFTLKYVF